MSQPPVTAYFNTRKRQACDDPRGKSKILSLERDGNRQAVGLPMNNDMSSKHIVLDESETGRTTSPKIVLLKDASVAATEENNVCQDKAVCNIQFDSPRTSAERNKLKARTKLRSRKLSFADGFQANIRESLQRMESDEDATVAKKVPFEKRGALSPKKPVTQKKSSSGTPPRDTAIKEETAENEQSAAGSVTPTKRGIMERLVSENLSLNDIKNRINKSSRMMELRACITRIKDCDQQLEQSRKQDNVKKPQMQKFEKIELEIPVR